MVWKKDRQEIVIIPAINCQAGKSGLAKAVFLAVLTWLKVHAIKYFIRKLKRPMLTPRHATPKEFPDL